VISFILQLTIPGEVRDWVDPRASLEVQSSQEKSVPLAEIESSLTSL